MEPTVIMEIYRHLFIIAELVYNNYFNGSVGSVSPLTTLVVSTVFSGLVAAIISTKGNERQHDKNLRLSLLDDLFRYKYLLLDGEDKTKLNEALSRVPVIFNTDDKIYKAYENFCHVIEEKQVLNNKIRILSEKKKNIEREISGGQKTGKNVPLDEELEGLRSCLSTMINEEKSKDLTKAYADLLILICKNLKVNTRDWDTEKIMRVITLK
ncbi:hypothetical protein Q5O14_14990 [Eubacteriaceae bacterium ES2]|nr:hypothetical protein Q5O14_14990 [Eubacteriaceae bacterium ES2]